MHVVFRDNIGLHALSLGFVPAQCKLEALKLESKYDTVLLADKRLMCCKFVVQLNNFQLLLIVEANWIYLDTFLSLDGTTC